MIKAELEKRLRHIAGDISKIDAHMMEFARKDHNMAKRMAQLTSIPGIGINTALMILGSGPVNPLALTPAA